MIYHFYIQFLDDGLCSGCDYKAQKVALSMLAATGREDGFISLSSGGLLGEWPQTMTCRRILKEERNYILQMIKKIRASGCNVVLIQKSILRDAVTDLSLHYLVRPMSACGCHFIYALFSPKAICWLPSWKSYRLQNSGSTFSIQDLFLKV